MKTKETQKQLEIEQKKDTTQAEVKSDGPSIASIKNNKIAVIAASLALTALVLYFIFSGDGNKDKQENLEPVGVPPRSAVAPSETGESPFEIKKPDNTEEVGGERPIATDKPAAPEMPTVPLLPADTMMPESINLAPGVQPSKQQQAQQPLSQNQQLPNQINNQQIQSPPSPQPVAEQKKPVDPRYAPIVVFSNGNGGTAPSNGIGYDQNIINIKQDPTKNLEKTTTELKAKYLSDCAHTIAQGKMIRAVLETPISTEVPGSVRAIVSEPVFAECGTARLVLPGSRLIGSYSSEIKKGQGRVQIQWTRLILPNGIDLPINFNASDGYGRSGVPGDVDNKSGPILAKALMTSLLSVAAFAAGQALIGGNNVTSTTVSNVSQGATAVTGSAANQGLYDMTRVVTGTVSKIINDSINDTPVITIPQGTVITVNVGADIMVPESKGYAQSR